MNIPLSSQDLVDADLLNVSVYNQSSWTKTRSYFSGTTFNGKQVFIKAGGSSEAVSREFLTSKLIFDLGEIRTPEVLSYHCNSAINFLVFEFIENSIPLNKIDINNLTLEQKNSILKDIQNIIQSLNKHKLIHRDFRPHNLLITKHSDVTLIDYQFLMDQSRKKFPELYENIRNPRVLLGLWGAYARGYFRWDDAHSALLIIKELGSKENKELININAELNKLIATNQAFGLSSNTRSFVFWFIGLSYQIFRGAIKSAFYSILLIFCKNSLIEKRKHKYLSRLKQHYLSLFTYNY